MITDEIGPLLRRAYTDTTDCPPPVAWLEESLSELAPDERERRLRHAEECPRCGAELVLARAFDDAPVKAEPGSDVDAIARTLGTLRFARRAPRARAWSARAWGLAAAAMLALAVVGVAVLEREGAPPLPSQRHDSVSRGGRIEILGPSGELDAFPAAFEWKTSPEAVSYRVRVLGVDDSVLLESTVQGTPMPLPAETRNGMHRAVVYFWQVEALDDRNRIVASSDRVRFRVRPEGRGRSL